MDFRHTEEQLAFYKSVKDFAAEVVEPGAHERDVEGRFDPEVWSKLGDFGLLGLPIPEEFGGSGAVAGSGHGVSAFIVERETPGFSVGRNLDKMGTRSLPLPLLHFDDCRVPHASMLGAEGSALRAIAFECFDWERTVMIASSVGGMKASLDAAVAYAKERVAFGNPIAKQQAIQHKLAEMKAALDASRLLLYRAAWLGRGCRTRPRPASRSCSSRRRR